MRRSSTWILLCSAAVILATICVSRAQFRTHGGPPWQRPVVSTQIIHVGGATIQVDFGPGKFDLPTDRIMHWVENAASSVATYYGRFPVTRDRILIEPAPGSGILRGTSWGDVGGFPAFHRMVLGEQTSQEELNDDWEMTHELVHSAFPSVDDAHHWIEEGLATYIEPIAQVQRGLLPAAKVWADMLHDMPKGSPEGADQGLDNTHSWGRTYWGGAQFCLLADVTIRQQTHNRKGLQDALRGIVNAGGTIDKDWPLRKALEIGDNATGTHVLVQLYDEMRDKPKSIDLDHLWQQLGLMRNGDSVRFDDHAPLANIRESITHASAIISAAPGK